MKIQIRVYLLSASLLLFGCGKKEEVIKTSTVRPIKMVDL